MKSLAELKAASTSKSSLSKLAEELKKLQTKTYESNDERFWYPNVDQAGNGSAIIRFLPPHPEEEVPFILEYKHSFKGPTGLYLIENCPTTIGKTCPVCEYNSTLWNSGDESKKKQASAQKRKKSYVSNIYIIKDGLNPENEGQVRLFRYGQKIFDKLNDLMFPKFDDEKSVDPFDFWEGPNFRMRIVTEDGYRNYDKSKFDEPSPLFDDDVKIDEIWKSQYKLLEFNDPKIFKSATEIQDRLTRVLGLDKRINQQVKSKEETSPSWEKSTKEATPPASPPSGETESSDAELDWLKQLAEEGPAA